MNPYGSAERSLSRTVVALSLGLLWMLPGAASADEVTCSAVKRALVSANLGVMRIERGPLSVTPVQASIAIGQMTALENIASVACSQTDLDKIAAVVTPRVEALQRLLPLDPADAGEPGASAQTEQPPVASGTGEAGAAGTDEAGTGAMASTGSPPPVPPERPANTDRAPPARNSVSAASCTRVYYTRDGHRFWRCKR